MSPQRSVPRDSEPRPSSRPVLPPCHLVYEFDTKFQLVVKPRTSLDNSHSYCIIIQLLLSHGGTRRHGTCWTSWGQLLPSCTQYNNQILMFRDTFRYFTTSAKQIFKRSALYPIYCMFIVIFSITHEMERYGQVRCLNDTN